jgi:hypothetical protein
MKSAPPVVASLQLVATTRGTNVTILGVPEFAPTGSAGFLHDRYGRSGEAAPRLPCGAAELGQLQDHYHQDDNDQDPDDDSDNSSVHFASLVHVLTRNFRSGR